MVHSQTFAGVVEGKKPETGTEKIEEGNMGNSAVEIDLVTIENSKKGKKKILEPENQAELKYEDMVARLNEGVINMKIMRDMLEDIKGKMKILDQRYELAACRKGKAKWTFSRDLVGLRFSWAKVLA